jgi:hypothetical protein
MIWIIFIPVHLVARVVVIRTTYVSYFARFSQIWAGHDNPGGGGCSPPSGKGRRQLPLALQKQLMVCVEQNFVFTIRALDSWSLPPRFVVRPWATLEY